MKRTFALLLVFTLIITCFAGSHTAVFADDNAEIVVNDAYGWLESAFITWQPVDEAKQYEVYCKKTSSDETEYYKINDMLIRDYDSYYRADVPGLAAGIYDLRVVAKRNEEIIAQTDINELTVNAHAREGFAFWEQSPNGGAASGGYDNDSGIVPEDARIVYITKNNVNTVTLDVVTGELGETTKCTGLADILAKRAKQFDKTPLIIRVIGMITASDMEGAKGGKYIDMKNCSNITIEGIGNDAVLYGLGVYMKRASNIEVRNLGFMMFPDDGISIDTGNLNIWVHNNDIFYGAPGSDSDQVKGDGSCDMKKASDCIVVSYNHFWESGKASLCGLSETQEFHATYHHNWFDHSDSRHPRIRTGTIHIYNNYYDGVSKYGVGVTTGASAFVESNVFRNCKYPMLSSKQGQDSGIFSGEDGGMIKAYNNSITGGSGVVYAQQNGTDFDAYLASDRMEQVPAYFKTKSGGTTYNNFDTADNMYEYTPTSVDETVENVTYYAGRVENGDFLWIFNNAVDDASYDVNNELKNAIVSYESKLVSVGGRVGWDAGGNTESYISEGHDYWNVTDNNTDNNTDVNTNVNADTNVNTNDVTANQPIINSGSDSDVNKVYTIKKYTYQILDEAERTAAVTGLTNKHVKKINIKSTVKINGKIYKIVKINASAFKNCSKAKQIIIGKNVNFIGKKAFFKCKKVKNITVNSKKVKADKNAFGKISKKVKVKLPDGKIKSLSKYKKSI